jgi:hypothetical protein
MRLIIKNAALTSLLFIAILLLSCKKTYEFGAGPVVINEVMSHNSVTAADDYGQFDDWIELYNLSVSPVNLSGYYLSDSKKNPEKWQFPVGTIIDAKGYLIIWADNDTTQLGLHANFSLSSDGENALLSKPNKIVIDKVTFPAQTLELSYSRVPNGTGAFKWQKPTFDRSNDPN